MQTDTLQWQDLWLGESNFSRVLKSINNLGKRGGELSKGNITEMDDEDRVGKIHGRPAEAAGHCSAQGAASLKCSQPVQGRAFCSLLLSELFFEAKQWLFCIVHLSQTRKRSAR